MSNTADKVTYRSVDSYGIATNSAKIESRDGKYIRARPLKFHEKFTEDEVRPYRFTFKDKEFKTAEKYPVPMFGYSWKNRIYSENRVLHPMKRVDWDPYGERNTQNRGKSGYERISWDEALEYISYELERIKRDYGTNAILTQAAGHGSDKNLGSAHGAPKCFLHAYGGTFCEEQRNPDSWEGWFWGANHFWGMGLVGKQRPIANTFSDICENSQGLLFWGCDVLTASVTDVGLVSSRICHYWRDLGIKQIYICPDVNYGCAVHADKWIPVLPNTDTALQLAIAYVWLTEGTYERKYLETHAVGFDNFAYYVLGGEDGIAKTPKWAEEKCGVPSRQIKALARYWAKNNISIVHNNGGGFIRSAYSHEPARMEVALLGMQGLGHPGRNMTYMFEWGLFGDEGSWAIAKPEFAPDVFCINTGGPGDTFYNMGQAHFIVKTLLPQALMLEDGEVVKWHGTANMMLPPSDQFVEYQFPNANGGNYIRMIWSDMPCWTTCWNNSFEFQEALRHPRIEFYLVQHPWFENDCFLADIVLPVCTQFERSDLVATSEGASYSTYLSSQASIEPLGESKDDFEITVDLAKRMGFFEKYMRNTFPAFADVDWSEHYDDWRDFLREQCWTKTWESAGREMPFDFEEFEDRGYYPVSYREDQSGPAGMIQFYEDPETFSLGTPSGKLEYYSSALAQAFPGDEARGPIPHWVEEDDFHHERLTNDRGKDYPFLLLSNHPHWRLHAQYDDVKWFREIPICKVKGPDGYLYEPLWINPADARRLSLKNGDIVKIFNERGATLGGVYVTERVMRNTLSQDHGSRVDPIVLGKGGFDRGGANNLLCPLNTSSKNAPGEVTNNFLVNIEKVDVFELAKQYPEAFSREYDPESGLVVGAFSVKEGE